MMKYFYYTLTVCKNNLNSYDRGIVSTDGKIFPLYAIMQIEAERNKIPINKVHIDFWAEISKEDYISINGSMNKTKPYDKRKELT